MNVLIGFIEMVLSFKDLMPSFILKAHSGWLLRGDCHGIMWVAGEREFRLPSKWGITGPRFSLDVTMVGWDSEVV